MEKTISSAPDTNQIHCLLNVVLLPYSSIQLLTPLRLNLSFETNKQTTTNLDRGLVALVGVGRGFG